MSSGSHGGPEAGLILRSLQPSLILGAAGANSVICFSHFSSYPTPANCGIFTLPTVINIDGEKCPWGGGAVLRSAQTCERPLGTPRMRARGVVGVRAMGTEQPPHLGLLGGAAAWTWWPSPGCR